MTKLLGMTKILMPICLLLIALSWVKVSYAWGIDGYGWGRVSFGTGTENTHIVNIRDAQTGNLIVPDNMTIWLSNPGLGTVGRYTCSGNCVSTVVIRGFTSTGGIPSNIRIDHNSHIEKAGYNTAESPGGFKLEPGVTTPESYTGTMVTTLDVYLTTVGTPPQFQGVSPAAFDYYSYIPQIQARINAFPGSPSVSLYMFYYTSLGGGNYAGQDFGPYSGTFPQLVTLGIDPSYPDNPMVRLDSYIEDPRGFRSSWGSFYFGLDRSPPTVSCSLNPTGTSTTSSTRVILQADDTISGVGEAQLQVSEDGGATWANAGPNGGNTTSNFQFTGTPGETYQFRYRARNNALNSSGARGAWSSYTSCGSVTLGSGSSTSTPIPSGDVVSTVITSDSLVYTGNILDISTTVRTLTPGNYTVVVKIFDPNDFDVLDTTFADVPFAAGESKTFLSQFTPNNTNIQGEYIIKVAVFDPTLTTTFHWNNDARRFDVIDRYAYGYIYFDLNKNGIKDPEDSGQGNVRIDIAGITNPIYIRSINTNGLGQYLFNGLEEGDYTLSVTLPNASYIETTPLTHNLTISPAVTNVEKNFGIFSSLLGGASGEPPTCGPLTADPTLVWSGLGRDNVSILNIVCDNADTYVWSLPEGPTMGDLLNLTSSASTNSYTAPNSMSVDEALVHPTVMVSGPGGTIGPFSVEITVKKYIGPWLKTEEGDVHSNQTIDVGSP